MMGLKSIEGLPIHDATKSVKISIKSTNAGGGRLEPGTCPVARACKNELGASQVFVHLSRVYIRNGKDHYTRYIIPRSLMTEIIAFDRGGSFQGGEFLLRKPQPSEKLGAARARKPRKRGPHATRMVPIHVLEGVRERPVQDKE